MAWEGVKEKPLLGWGQENFNLVFNKYYEPSLYGQEVWFDRVHNEDILQITLKNISGIIAIECFVSLLYNLL